MALSVDIVGLTYTHPDHYVVGREKIREYATAVKNDDAAYFAEDAAHALGHSAILAPPTFMSIFALRAQMAFFADANIPILDEKLIQAEQGFTMLRPIMTGDTLRCHFWFDSLRQAFGADVLTIKGYFTNQRDERVLEAYTVMAGRSEPV